MPDAAALPAAPIRDRIGSPSERDAYRGSWKANLVKGAALAGAIVAVGISVFVAPANAAAIPAVLTPGQTVNPLPEFCRWRCSDPPGTLLRNIRLWEFFRAGTIWYFD